MAATRTGITLLAQRYALAFFRLGEQQHVLDTLEQDVLTLQAAIDKSVDLQFLLRSPLLSRQSLEQGVKALSQTLKLSEIMLNFLGALAQNRRLNILTEVLKAFLELLAKHRGQQTVHVTSAQVLTSAQEQALTQALAASTGKKVQVKTAVDPGLIGGLVVKIGSKVIDSSLQTQLQRLEKDLKGAA